jgi:hypothetical protein
MIMSGDNSFANDALGVMVAQAPGERANWLAHMHVDKYDDDQVKWVQRRMGALYVPQGQSFEYLGVKPSETVDVTGNLVTTAGWTRLTSLMVGGGGQALTNTATRLGVGNSTTAAAIGQTDLQAAAGTANRYFMTMDATYPSAATNVITARASFATGDANFVWAEWALDVGTPTVTAGATVNAVMINRAVQALGTKASGVWTATATITFT